MNDLPICFYVSCWSLRTPNINLEVFEEEFANETSGQMQQGSPTTYSAQSLALSSTNIQKNKADFSNALYSWIFGIVLYLIWCQ